MLSLKVAFFAALAEALVLPKGLSSISLEGCLKKLPHGQSAGSVANVTITSGGLLRYYLIAIPPTYHNEVPTPAILSYHGGERTAESQLELDELTSSQFNTNTFVIYPQGINVGQFDRLEAAVKANADITAGLLARRSECYSKRPPVHRRYPRPCSRTVLH